MKIENSIYVKCGNEVIKDSVYEDLYNGLILGPYGIDYNLVWDNLGDESQRLFKQLTDFLVYLDTNAEVLKNNHEYYDLGIMLSAQLESILRENLKFLSGPELPYTELSDLILQYQSSGVPWLLNEIVVAMSLDYLSIEDVKALCIYVNDSVNDVSASAIRNRMSILVNIFKVFNNTICRLDKSLYKALLYVPENIFSSQVTKLIVAYQNRDVGNPMYIFPSLSWCIAALLTAYEKEGYNTKMFEKLLEAISNNDIFYLCKVKSGIPIRWQVGMAKKNTIFEYISWEQFSMILTLCFGLHSHHIDDSEFSTECTLEELLNILSKKFNSLYLKAPNRVKILNFLNTVDMMSLENIYALLCYSKEIVEYFDMIWYEIDIHDEEECMNFDQSLLDYIGENIFKIQHRNGTMEMPIDIALLCRQFSKLIEQIQPLVPQNAVEFIDRNIKHKLSYFEF